jgi:hypothetical protein
MLTQKIALGPETRELRASERARVSAALPQRARRARGVGYSSPPTSVA